MSSIGRLLKSCGYSVTAIKVDPYLNVDAGTMSPFEHGEVFVLEDGGECDLDLGNYERFLDIAPTCRHNLTTGKIFEHIIHQERKGSFLGKTVQIVPHLTDAIVNWILSTASTRVEHQYKHAEVLLLEIGGSVGDLESGFYYEALRQLSQALGEKFALGLVTYVPEIGGTQKTKPTQHGVKQMLMTGLRPDFLFCRADSPLKESTIVKIANSVQLPKEHILSMHNARSPYEVPLILEKMGFHDILLNRFGLESREPKTQEWANFVENLLQCSKDTELPHCKVALVGKYTGETDTYVSIYEAIKHAAAYYKCYYEIIAIDSTDLEEESSECFEKAWANVRAADAILVPGGFGSRGFEGMVKVINYARLNKVPFLGICLGFQAAVVEYARNVLNLPTATSSEFSKSHSDEKVISTMEEHHGGNYGGTLRLGATLNFIAPSTLASKLYNKAGFVLERHRHRYEVSGEYLNALREGGLIFSGEDNEHAKMGILELSQEKHPFFFGVQFHPEFPSRPLQPVPAFASLILAGLEDLKKSSKNMTEFWDLAESTLQANNTSTFNFNSSHKIGWFLDDG
eukprot:CAMPEP_0115043766 /NCGR_PEP_ID=MMETSP0216-20121206/47073_1 /TAXON_ID=223996 /ORGANISM="Protocruzia adherens, Strain Boccale" /LENGTH=570 /DNA_ID=CAMNT_0002426167 /DNA_START=43 /DNA_END=1756 /DNA_ORIENTATION=+